MYIEMLDLALLIKYIVVLPNKIYKLSMTMVTSLELKYVFPVQKKLHFLYNISRNGCSSEQVVKLNFSLTENKQTNLNLQESTGSLILDKYNYWVILYRIDLQMEVFLYFLTTSYISEIYLSDYSKLTIKNDWNLDVELESFTELLVEY